MATMRDIAKKAGVGVGTVSRALSDTGYTAKKTRARILAAADEMGYDYESAGRIRQKTVSVGILLPLLRHPFFAKMADFIEMELQKFDYRSIIINNGNKSNHQTELLEMLDENIINGLIVLDSPPPDFDGRGQRAIVSMDRNWGPDVPIVHSDHAQGGRLAAEAFLECGCQSVIQFIGGQLNPSFHSRHTVLEHILRDNGCQVTSVHTPWNIMGYSYDRGIIRDYWNVIREMDGCMTNDVAAVSCLALAQENGVRVPEELRIIGYDGTELTQLCQPILSVVEQDFATLAKCCVERIMELLEGTTPVEMETIVPVIWKKGGTT